MFDFLFRRQAKRKEPHSPETRQAEERAAQKEDARQAALMQADALAGDESAAVAFILGCPFADARLKAAEYVHSRQEMEQVHNAMRNVDRRVARLMQTRLDALRQKEKAEHAANGCIEAAGRLAGELHLTPSQAAELDRNWQALGDVAPDRKLAFDKVRSEISGRLAEQAALQRKVMDALARLRKIAASPDEFSPEELRQTADSLAAEIAACVTSRELPSLPRNLLPAFEEEFRKLKSLQEGHELRRQAAAERLEALERWENSPAEDIDRHEIERQWHAMRRPDESDMALFQERLNALLRRAQGQGKTPVQKQQRKESQHSADENRPAFADILAAFEKSLEEGALHLAAEHDETLRSLHTDKSHVDASLAERLNQARSELKRLQDWARWGGRVSREELIRSVQDLPSQQLELDELANRVTDARKTWKSLDAASGSASKASWEQFDAACNAAYAPVAERGRRMADERDRNAEAARTMIEQVREFAAGALPDPTASETDWKGVAAFYRRARQSWRQLGTIERKLRKQLDAEFEQAVSALQQPLERQWQAEAARREQLIDAVGVLDPKSRGTVDAVRRLQEQWQESARGMPLGAREEQDLWRRFREACDGLFAHRKEAADAADVSRRRNLADREAVCAKLEAAIDEPIEEVSGTLAESAAEWRRIGPEPKSDQDAVQKRYRMAVAALQARLDAADADARSAGHRVLIEKLNLCQAAESAVAGGEDANVTGWHLHWQVLPQLNPKQESMLHSRFESAISALASGDSLYAAMLEANRPQLLEELLRLEILLGLDSPQEFSQERMKAQVEVLQDSLAGNKGAAMHKRVDILCSLPAATDEQSASRIAHVLQAASGGGK